MSYDALGKIETAIGQKLQEAFEDRKQVLTHVREVADAIEWYGKAEEAKKEPGKFEAMVVNKIIEKLQRVVAQEVVNLSFNRVILEGEEGGNTDVEFDLTINMPPFKPSVYFILVIDGIPLRNNAVKISFELDGIVKLRRIRIYSDPQEKWFRVKRIEAIFTLFLLSSMMIGKKKIEITEAKILVEDLEFRKSVSPPQ